MAMKLIKVIRRFSSTYRVPLITLLASLFAIWLLSARPCGFALLSECTANNFTVWQVAIGAVLGLTGLLFGAIYNAELNRQRDDRLRQDKGKALAVGLASEFQRLRDYYRTVGGWVGHSLKENVVFYPERLAKFSTRRSTPVYDNNTANFGLLGPDLSLSIGQSVRYASDFFDLHELIASMPTDGAGGIRRVNIIKMCEMAFKWSKLTGKTTVDLMRYAGEAEHADDLESTYIAEDEEDESWGIWPKETDGTNDGVDTATD